MNIVDVNVLLYTVNSDSSHHAACRGWWEQALNGDEPIGLTFQVISGFLRIATKPAVFERPLSVEDALGRLNTWLAHPNVELMHERPEVWPIFRQLVGAVGTAGNLVTDAHLAAIAIHHGATLISCDHDFARFPQLRWQNPLARQ